MLRVFGWLCLFLLAGCASRALDPELENKDSAGEGSALLNDRGEAPELTSDVWINTEQPLRLEDLRGKVVLLDMWTFG